METKTTPTRLVAALKTENINDIMYMVAKAYKEMLWSTCESHRLKAVDWMLKSQLKQKRDNSPPLQFVRYSTSIVFIKKDLNRAP